MEGANPVVGWVEKPVDGDDAYHVWLDANGYNEQDHPVSEYNEYNRGKSAREIYNATYNKNLNDAEFAAELKMNYPMLHVGYDSTNAGATIGVPFSGNLDPTGDDIAAGETTMGKLYLMPDAASDPENCIGFVTVLDGQTYKWCNVGAIRIPSDVLAKSDVDNECTNGTVDTPASANIVMGLKKKLQGVTFEETKAENLTDYILDGESSTGYYKNDGTWQNSSNHVSTRIDVHGCDSIRFLGYAVKSSTIYYGFEDENGDIITKTLKNYEDKTLQSNVTILREYTINVPSNAYYFVCLYNYGGTSITLKPSNFYCYLQSGDNVVDMIPVVANDFNGGVDKALSAEKGKELYEELYTSEEYIPVSVTSMKNFIQASNKWASDSYYRGGYVAVNPGDRFILTTDDNNGYNALYAFLQSLRTGTQTTVEYATGYSQRKSMAPNRTITITAPADANYLYLHRVQRANSQSIIILPTIQKIISKKNKFDIINEEVDGINNNINVIQSMLGKMTLVIPDGFRSAETVNKCQNTVFTPLHRLKATGTGNYFEEGTEYSGLPYYSTQSRNDSLYNFTLETIFSMWNNPYSLLYTYPENHNGSYYTGAVCSSVACWFTSYPLWIPTQDIVTMLDRKTINDISDVEIGDVLVCNETIRPGDMDHAMVVYDILFDMNGIKNIVVFEAWYSGTLTSRTYTFTPSGFMNLLKGTGRGSDLYIIGRLGNKIRTVQPLVVNTDIISERGDNTYYEQGEDIFVQSSQDTFTAISPSGNSVSVDFSNKPLKEGTNMRNIGDVLNSEIGTWTLNGIDEEKSHLKVIKKGSTVLYTDGTDNNKCTVTLSGYEGCKPCAYAIIGIRNSSGVYPSPVSNKTAGRMTAFSKSNPRAWGVITPTGNTTTFNVDLTGHGSVYIGYYVRLFYETGCGQAWQDTWDGKLNSGVGYIMF